MKPVELYRWQLDNGMRCKDMASLLGMSVYTISAWRRGSTRIPGSVALALALATEAKAIGDTPFPADYEQVEIGPSLFELKMGNKTLAHALDCSRETISAWRSSRRVTPLHVRLCLAQMLRVQHNGENLRTVLRRHAGNPANKRVAA